MVAVTVYSDFGSQENRGFLFLENKPRLFPRLCVIEPLAVSQDSSPLRPHPLAASSSLSCCIHISLSIPLRGAPPHLWASEHTGPLPRWASDGLLLSIQSWTKHWPAYLRWLPARSTLQLLFASLLIAFFHGSPQYCDGEYHPITHSQGPVSPWGWWVSQTGFSVHPSLSPCWQLISI